MMAPNIVSNITANNLSQDKPSALDFTPSRPFSINVQHQTQAHIDPEPPRYSPLAILVMFTCGGLSIGWGAYASESTVPWLTALIIGAMVMFSLIEKIRKCWYLLVALALIVVDACLFMADDYYTVPSISRFFEGLVLGPTVVVIGLGIWGEKNNKRHPYPFKP